jgi:hypothetical protein
MYTMIWFTVCVVLRFFDATGVRIREAPMTPRASTPYPQQRRTDVTATRTGPEPLRRRFATVLGCRE